jgi:feruloyl-CoA synthase
MPVVNRPGLRPVNMGELSVDMVEGAGGVRYVRPRARLGAYPRTLLERLDHWASVVPDRTLFADRGVDGAWRRLSYAEMRDRSFAIGQFLLDRGLSAERPLVILSGNSLEHIQIAYGALRAGIPYAPVSPAYSLVAKDYAKLHHVFGLLTPGMVFVADAAPFAPALAASLPQGVALAAATNLPAGAISFAEIAATKPGAAVREAYAAISGDTVAKFLFTSGSTGLPKAVINTHRMMAANQVMIAHALAFVQDQPPVMVDWLPWNHTAGGNHNTGIALHNGGTFYIDDGAPTPAGIAKSVRNLEEVAPTLYFNVPKGYEMLAANLKTSERLRRNFFSDLQLMQYSGAGLSQHVWDALESLAVETTGRKVMIITGYGSTETAPFASTTTWPVDRPGEVGLPAPGLELKLIPDGEKLELRLKGPSITPGYWRMPEKSAESFDEEGFYRIGDALKFVDPSDPNRGFLFDGRVSEDFKLDTGTWVNFAAIKGSVIRAFAPYVRDAVLTGLNRSHIGALLFLDVDAARGLAPELAAADEATLARSPALAQVFQERLDALAEKSTGSSTLVARARVLDRAPSLDASEITDKGSINQRAVLAARAAEADSLYAEPAPAGVLVARLRKAA